jgi:Putative restriction endonuclease
MDDDQLLDFCAQNKELRIERNAEGDLEILAPTGGETSNKNAGLTARVWAWAEQDGTGVAFDSNGGFVLPNGAMRAPMPPGCGASGWQTSPPNRSASSCLSARTSSSSCARRPTRWQRSRPRCENTSRTARAWGGSSTRGRGGPTFTDPGAPTGLGEPPQALRRARAARVRARPAPDLGARLLASSLGDDKCERLQVPGLNE